MHAAAAPGRRAPIAFLIVALSLTAAATGWLGWDAYRACRRAKATSDWALRVDGLRGTIVHLDEVLTMSARMAAATGDPAWEKRYREFEPKLDAAIKEAIRLAPEARSARASAETDAANALLVEMENRAFGLVRQGRLNDAKAILLSREYETQKAVYAKGMATLAGDLANTTAARLDAEWRRALVSLGVAALALPLLVAAWLVVMRSTRAWQAGLVAARGEAEAKLLRLALVAEQAGQGIALADLDGRLQFVNAAWANMHGYETGDELIGKHLSVFHTEEQMRNEVLPTTERVLPEGRYTGEVGHVRKDGTPFVVSMTGTLLRDADGRPIGLAALAADVTERRRAEEAVRASEEKLRAILDNVGIGIALNSPELKVLSVNNQMKKWFPDVDAAQRPTCYRVFNDPPGEAPCPDCPVVRTLQDGQAHDAVRATPAGSEIRHYRLVSSPLKDSDGRVTAVIEMVEDITERTRNARALADSEAKFRALFERTSEAVMLSDEQAFFDCNDAALAVFGCTSREEFLQRHPADLSPPAQPSGQDSLSAASEQIATALATGTARFEWVHRRADGTDFPAEVLLNALELGGRKVLQGVVRDVSERKRTEEALRQSEERFRQVAESAGEWIWEVDADGLYRYSSPAVESILGYSPDELVGQKHFHDLFPPDVREELKAAALATIARKEPFRHFVNPNVHKNGKIVTLETSGSPVLDEDGGLLGFRGTDMDITERKRAEEALRTSEEKFRTLVERIPAVVYAISLDGSPVAGYASPRAEAMLGLSGVDVDRWVHQLHPEDRERVMAEVASCHATGEPLVTEYRLVRPDGRVVWLHDEGAIVRDPTGRPTLHLGVLLDITERKQASEKLGRTLAELELFNRLAVGRELRMIELKREVNEMARAAGLRLPYDLSSLEPAAEAAEARLRPQTGKRAARNPPSVAGGSPGTVPDTSQGATRPSAASQVGSRQEAVGRGQSSSSSDSPPALAYAQEAHP